MYGSAGIFSIPVNYPLYPIGELRFSMQNKLEGPKTELADLLAGKIRRKSGNKRYITVTSKSIGGERGQRAQFWS